MPIDYSDKPGDKYDPNDIARNKSMARRDKPGQQVAHPAKNAGTGSPIIDSIKNVVKGSHLYQRHKLRQETSTLETYRGLVQTKTGLAKDEGELTDAEHDLYARQSRNAAQGDDTDDEIKFHSESRKLDRQIALDAKRMEADRARRAHDKEFNPAPKAPKESNEERIRREAENIGRYGNTGLHTKMARETEEKIIREAGGEQNLTDEQREYLKNLRAWALRQDQSKS